MKKIAAAILFLITGLFYHVPVQAGWHIGTADRSSSEFALAPDKYADFLRKDFGFEDRYFLIGHDREAKSFPYVLPGPGDRWGGAGGFAGWRSHTINILFGIQSCEGDPSGELTVDLLDASGENPPLFKVLLNDREIFKEYISSGKGDEAVLSGAKASDNTIRLRIPVAGALLKKGGNQITLTILEGSWVMFDHLSFTFDNKVELVEPESVFVRGVRPAAYELSDGKKNYQPLLVDVEHLKGGPLLSVELDGKSVFEEKIDSGRYLFEVPMPAVTEQTRSAYRILADGKTVETGVVLRNHCQAQTVADYVDTKIGSGHSRWMIAPGPWMPFSMVKLSPDNQNSGWQAGYDPIFESIGNFSHIHEWTMAGLGMLPVNGALQIETGDERDPDSGYRSRIDKATEEAPIGYYKVHLTDYDIWAEITSTTRAGFQRYTFPEGRGNGRVMINLQIPAENGHHIEKMQLRKTGASRIEGFSEQTAFLQDYTVFFVIEFDRPVIKVGGWIGDEISAGTDFAAEKLDDAKAGMYVEFDVEACPVVQVRSAISLVSLENADLNLKTEISEPFGWDFDAVRNHHFDTWNDLLGRIDISTTDRIEKIRFYTNLYRTFCSRNIWSDVNGQWRDSDKRIQQLKPGEVALGGDAFWNTFWNLNQVWNLIAPEWSSKWVKSQLAMYDAGGWLAKGPAGMKYIPIMVAEHEIPLIVGAYQMGIRDFDAERAFEAMKKMQTTPPTPTAGNKNLVPYLKYKYVPSDLGRFSNTLEYSFDDWTVSQMAKALGKEQEYEYFFDRGSWWRNAFNPENKFAHMKNSKGAWEPNFDPFLSGKDEHYVEGNAWQLSFFVPQDVPALAELIGKDTFVERLDWGFEASEPYRFNAPNDEYWFYPVVQGNQQSMHFAYLYNWVQEPWKTQRWSRSVAERYYGIGTANAYLGDEDQGQMSAWFILASIGLFQTDGGCRVNPIYEIGSPLYEKIKIDLRNEYGRGDHFIIEAKNTSRKNKYVQRALLNGRELETFFFPASELLKGGSLILEMGDRPNKSWGLGLPERNTNGID